MNSIMTSITGGIAAGSMFAALAIAQPAPHYTVTDLGTLGSGTYSSANNVSNGGFVVGLSAIDSSATSPLQAALWDHRSPHTIMDIGLFAYWWTQIAGGFPQRPLAETGLETTFLVEAGILALALAVFVTAVWWLAVLTRRPDQIPPYH